MQGPLIGSKEVEQNERLTELVHDGLHVGPLGYKIMFHELMRLIRVDMSELAPETLPFVFPTWDDQDTWKSL